jgi:two-component system cell cycle response regulator
LVVLDVMMPMYDGFELCRKLKANPETEDIQVVLFTAAPEDFIVERILETGADDYILKPIDALGMEAKIRDMLGLS